MGCERAEQGPVREILNPVLGASSLDYGRERGIVKMRNLRKQMVLYLKVQAAQVPSQERVASSEVNCGCDLVHCPLLVYPICSLKRHHKGGFLNAVSQLEHDT